MSVNLARHLTNRPSAANGHGKPKMSDFHANSQPRRLAYPDWMRPSQTAFSSNKYTTDSKAHRARNRAMVLNQEKVDKYHGRKR